MSWAKRNIYFLVSCIVAVVLLGAAGWYCWASSQANNANWDQLKAAYDQLKTLADKPFGPGNDKVNNIQAAKEQTEEVKKRVAEMEKFFTPIPSIPNTNHLNDRILAFAVRDTVSQIRAAAQARGVTVPTTTPDFAFSFSLQMGKTIYDPNSADMLARQLGEVKVICDTLFAARIMALDSIQRERTSDDSSQQGQYATQPDYVDSISVTNGSTVISPYQITFECFTPQLGTVLANFANQKHTMVVKTLDIAPADMIGGMGMDGGGGRYPSETTYGNPYGTPQATFRGGLPTIIDEKKLKVIMLVDVVKIVPEQGR
ncbi:MAG TPA: Amuc_1100 family pilus-like protein [Verrucomicrobiae bacterium]|nr:Amuc_1100 family pilus-like protein [Verrucomicrobiae bacterium]